MLCTVNAITREILESLSVLPKWNEWGRVMFLDVELQKKTCFDPTETWLDLEDRKFYVFVYCICVWINSILSCGCKLKGHCFYFMLFLNMSSAYSSEFCFDLVYGLLYCMKQKPVQSWGSSVSEQTKNLENCACEIE